MNFLPEQIDLLDYFFFTFDFEPFLKVSCGDNGHEQKKINFR